MTNAQMIAKAWLNDEYRAELMAQGVQVPPRPEDLSDDELDPLNEDGENVRFTAQCCTC